MHKFRAAVIGLLCLGAVTGCSTNTNPGNVVFTTKATLELAVGTISDPAGTLQAQTQSVSFAGPYLDVIAPFRNQLGNSAFNLPGDATLTPGSGTDNMGFTFNPKPPNAPGFIGIFGYGQSGPLFGATVWNQLPAAAPAWAAPGSGTGFMMDVNPSGPDFNCCFGDLPSPAQGYPLAGNTSYSLVDTVTVNGQVQTYKAGATLAAVPTFLAVGSAAYAPAAGTGGGTFNFGAYPAGATEQVVVVLSGAPPASVLAMVKVNTPVTSGALPAGTLAIGAYTCFVIATDFPWVEAGSVTSPAVGNPAPVITGANGNADMSVSGTFACNQT
jgi:hypothetical protein